MSIDDIINGRREAPDEIRRTSYKLVVECLPTVAKNLWTLNRIVIKIVAERMRRGFSVH